MKKVLLLCFLVFSCASTNPRDYDHVPGGLKPDQVQGQIRKAFPQIRTCYLQSGSFKKKVTGRILVSFRIEENGSVSEGSILKSNFRDSPLHDCILEKIKGIQFPPPVGGGYVDVSYPFHFRFKNDAKIPNKKTKNTPSNPFREA